MAAYAEPYEVGPDGAGRIALTVEKTGLYRGKKHLFLLEKYAGRLDYNAQKPEASKLELTLDSRSLVCKDDWISAGEIRKVEKAAHDDMLAVRQFPAMNFSSGAIQPLGEEKFAVQGMLTIRGIAKPVSLTVQLDASNPGALRLEGSAVIRLTDYKLKPPSALLGLIGTRDEMTLQFTVFANRIGKEPL